MHNKPTFLPKFESVIGGIIEDFILEKKALGYKYTVETRKLYLFDHFLLTKDLAHCTLPKTLVKEWTRKKNCEHSLTHRLRFRLIRQFAEFMQNRGYDVYVPNADLEPVARSNFTPYIFTHDEIHRLITSADHLTPHGSSPHRHIVIPEMFRLLYGCGLRLGEALRLTLADIDLEQGILTIHQSKFRKDRIVPIAPELTIRLRQLLKKLGNRYDGTYPLFPSPTGGAYSMVTIYCTFRKLLEQSGIVHRGRGKGPRIHDLRHSYAVHRMQKWFQEGIDLTTKLPILAAYMGHTTFRCTQHYVHLTLEFSTDLSTRLDNHYGSIIPRSNEK